MFIGSGVGEVPGLVCAMAPIADPNTIDKMAREVLKGEPLRIATGSVRTCRTGLKVSVSNMIRTANCEPEIANSQMLSGSRFITEGNNRLKRPSLEVASQWSSCRPINNNVRRPYGTRPGLSGEFRNPPLPADAGRFTMMVLLSSFSNGRFWPCPATKATGAGFAPPLNPTNFTVM